MSTNRSAVLTLAASLVLVWLPACSMMKPMTTEEKDAFCFGGYPDSQDRRECQYEADKATASIGKMGDIYANIQWAQTRSRQCPARNVSLPTLDPAFAKEAAPWTSRSRLA